MFTRLHGSDIQAPAHEITCLIALIRYILLQPNKWYTHFIFTLESKECPTTDGTPPRREWVLTDEANNKELGTSDRIREKRSLITPDEIGEDCPNQL